MPDSARAGNPSRRVETCTGKKLRTVSRADVKRAAITNTATSTGVDPRGQTSAISHQARATLHPAKPRPIKQRLALQKTVSVGYARPLQNVTYTIAVENPGRTAITHVLVCDAMPESLNYISSQPRAVLRTGRYCWIVKRLASHAHDTFKITGNIVTLRPVAITNHATATAPHTVGAKAAATVRVHAPHIEPCAIASSDTAGPQAHAAC